MGAIHTEAWVLRAGLPGEPTPATLNLEPFTFPDLGEHEVLVEPLYGCWEGNMTHALQRDPIDICRVRGEDRIVLGNAGVVRVLRPGVAVTSVKEGDVCALCPAGVWNDDGYLLRILGYDAIGTMGLLAKRVKLHERQLVHIPDPTKFDLRQWAASTVRYTTAWANWKVAYGCWRLQTDGTSAGQSPHVWGWGGGVALAELALAKLAGCSVAMTASKDERLDQIRAMGITAIDRRRFPDLQYDHDRYQRDRPYRKRHVEAVLGFEALVVELTGGAKVSIFIDNIGAPMLPATLRALGHRGVLTTAGWKKGMRIPLVRANECIAHRIHVHTHGCPIQEAAPAQAFAEATGWIPPVEQHVYGWDEVPQLAAASVSDTLASYFPLFHVNPL